MHAARTGAVTSAANVCTEQRLSFLREVMKQPKRRADRAEVWGGKLTAAHVVVQSLLAIEIADTWRAAS